MMHPAFPDVMARLRVPQSSDTVTQRESLITRRSQSCVAEFSSMGSDAACGGAKVADSVVC
jgi:hypothetical protein